MTYTISGVSRTIKDWHGKGGAMRSYRLKFAEAGDTVVEINQKAATPPPKIGDVLEGTIDMTSQYGPQFKKDYTRKPGAGAGGGRKDDETIKSEFAIKTAANSHAPLKPTSDVDTWIASVENLAVELFAMVDRIKGPKTSVEAPEQPGSDPVYDLDGEPFDEADLPEGF